MQQKTLCLKEECCNLYYIFYSFHLEIFALLFYENFYINANEKDIPISVRLITNALKKYKNTWLLQKYAKVDELPFTFGSSSPSLQLNRHI